MKQIHKNQALSRVKCTNNILKIWKLASDTDKFDWYQDALNFASSIHADVNKACGVIAALSPLKTWEQNKKQALKFIQTGNCGHMGAFKCKARLILDSDGSEDAILRILAGKKIQSFYLNIRYPEKAISLTIDRHALSVALGHWIDQSEYSMTAGQYKFFSECYRHAGAKLNVSPLIVQSATWLVWRRIKKEYAK